MALFAVPELNKLEKLALHNPTAYRQQYGRHIVLAYIVLAGYALFPLIIWLMLYLNWVNKFDQLEGIRQSWFNIIHFVSALLILPSAQQSLRIINLFKFSAQTDGIPLQRHEAPQFFNCSIDCLNKPKFHHLAMYA
jgi:hypothetical protein